MRFDVMQSAITWAVQHRKWILGVTVIATVFAAVIASQTLAHLQLARFAAPNSTSIRAAEILEDNNSGTPNLTLLIDAPAGVDDSEVAAAATKIEEQLIDHSATDNVFSYWSAQRSPHLRSHDGTQGLIMARLLGDATTARNELGKLAPQLAGNHGPIEVSVGGRDEIFRQAAEQARSDFALAELIIIPGVFLLLLLILRRVVAALVTLSLGIISVVGAMAILRGAASLTDVSVFAANLVLIMGIALGVDYGLFVIARFREARHNGQSIEQAAISGALHAGSTVLVSAAAVCAAMIVLLLFPFDFLQSFTYAGLAVVGCAAFVALIVLPATLATWGRYIDAPARTANTFRYSNVISMVLRHPWISLIGGLIIVVLLGAPSTSLNVGPPDDRTLPPTASSRMVQDQLRTNFSSEIGDIITIVPAPNTPPWTADETDTYATKLQQVHGVAEVIQPVKQGIDLSTPLAVIPTGEILAENPYGFVENLRNVTPPDRVFIGGYPAELSDYRDLLTQRLPYVIATMLIISTGVLIAATRTIVLPLKAAFLNLLSLSVLGGVLVWVFQQGHFGDLIGITATGSLDLSIPILMFCIAFGLSMDYEVLIVLRILEQHHQGKSIDAAIRTGIAHTAPLVSAAAAVLAASFMVYLSSSISYLKMLGVGMALVVCVDATIIRLILLPSSMKLMGRANWWWPTRRRQASGMNASDHSGTAAEQSLPGSRSL